MIKKIVISLLLLFINKATIITVSYALSKKQYIANEVNFRVIVNGEEKKFQLTVVTIDDSTYLPVREFCGTIGYSVDWHEESEVVSMYSKKNLIFTDNISEGHEGTLDNGRKYIFYGTDAKDYSLNDYVENKHVQYKYTYNKRITSTTIKEIAEEIQLFFQYESNYAEIPLIVSYDSESNSLIFYNDFTTSHLGGTSILVMNCSDGFLSMYSNGVR